MLRLKTIHKVPMISHKISKISRFMVFKGISHRVEFKVSNLVKDIQHLWPLVVQLFRFLDHCIEYELLDLKLIIIFMQFLTVTVRAGSRLPKSSKMLITAEMSTIAQKSSREFALKFKNESFGGMKLSKNFFRRKFHRK